MEEGTRKAVNQYAGKQLCILVKGKHTKGRGRHQRDLSSSFYHYSHASPSIDNVLMLTIGTQREKVGVCVHVFKGLSRGIVVGSGVIIYCWVSYLEGGKVTLVLGLPQKAVYPSNRIFVRGARDNAHSLLWGASHHRVQIPPSTVSLAPRGFSTGTPVFLSSPKPTIPNCSTLVS